MFYEDQPLEQPQDAFTDRICILCGTERDSFGCCQCDPPAVVCGWCGKLITMGKGLPDYEAGIDLTVSTGCCDNCFEEQMEKIR